MLPLVILLGPTASGKSSLAVELAERLDGEVINADALQAYCGLDIGTGKPSLADRARVPHLCFDLLDPRERFSAADFARRAALLISEIRSRGRLPIVVGGSGLYLRALLIGLAPIPNIGGEVAAQLELRLQREGLAALFAELRLVDPATAARVGERDTQRILRALAVALATGRSLSDWHSGSTPSDVALPAKPWVRIGLRLPRALLRQRVAERVDAMLRAGWIREVAELLASGVPADAHAFQAIGYRQVITFLAGKVDERELRQSIIDATRQYAKRQETWFRREPAVSWLAADQAQDRLLAEACDLVTAAAARP